MTLHKLFEQGPEAIRAWLDRVSSGSVTTPDDFTWLRLAEEASERATYPDAATSDQERLVWASIAVSAYDYLARTTEDLKWTTSVEISAMMLRANMIKKLGAVPGHPLLDPSTVSHWFFDRLPFPRAEAARLAVDWLKRPVAEILLLRQIKNRLLVIKELMKDGYLTDDQELQRWVELRERLP